MRAVNPGVVMTPDGRRGVLVAVHENFGCIAVGKRRILETHPLVQLSFLLLCYFPEKATFI